MTAYRLHFEPATLDAIRRIRAGEIGDPDRLHLLLRADGRPGQPSRFQRDRGRGPVFDMAPYPINAIRYLFGAEPMMMSAVGTRHPQSGCIDFNNTVAVTLRMPGDRLAQFTVSYYANTISSFIMRRHSGVDPHEPRLRLRRPAGANRQIGEKKTHEALKATDQFGGEMKYFSDCILHDRTVSRWEGLADLLVIEAIVAASGSCGWKIKPLAYSDLPPEPVNASSPSKN
ncbi:Gfo/Idh/MocA family protein [Sphingomonas sp. MMS24-JH45]